MSKPIAVSILACFTLTGCTLFQKSPTWDKVVRTRVSLPRDGDASRIYAEGLHHELKAAGVEHKVVKYQYRFRSRLREGGIAEATAVIYRDDSNAAYPWWIKDQRSGRPTWLPNGSVQQQVRFYVGRDVEIIGPESGSGGGEKRIVRTEAPSRRSAPEEAFRDAHGTAFDKNSAVDRQKLLALLRSRNRTADLRTF
jgi:hypothetical protein